MSVLAARHVVLGAAAPRAIRPAVIHLDGPRIAKVEVLAPESYAERVAELPEVLDLGDRLLSPAFINAHTHIALGFVRGLAARSAAQGNLVEDLFFRLESNLTGEDAAAFARMGAYECLLHGQAVVWDHYYHAEAVAEAAAETGLSVVMAPTLQDLDGPGKADWAMALEATERLADRGGAGGIWAAVGPHATDTVSASLWRRATELAAQRHLPMHAHVAQSIDEVRRVDDAYGCSPVGWLDRLGVLDRTPSAIWAHCLYAGTDDLKRLDPDRHALAYCPYSQLVFGFEARVDVWQQAGLPVVVGTDTSASNDSMNVQKELRALGASPTRGVSFSEAYQRFLATGTRTAAEVVDQARNRDFAEGAAFGFADRVLDAVWTAPGRRHPGFVAGTIEVGALGHLAVWNLDHPAFWPAHDPLAGLAFGDTSAALHGLWVSGRAIGTLGEGPQSLTATEAYRAARSEADARCRRLVAVGRVS